MCGIAGIVKLRGQPIDPLSIKRMCDMIAHRGPDDAGYLLFDPGHGANRRGAQCSAFADPEFAAANEHLPLFGGGYCRRTVADMQITVALGHRRLSIIDLSAYGHQPMGTADQRYWIVYNGEIYNYRQLRDALEIKGYHFRTRTDTEVILYLWEEYGRDALAMLNGMFALAIFDQQEYRIVLARDRFGVKPLYLAVTDDYLLFASEPKAFFASGLVRPALDAAGLVEYVTFQNRLGRGTIWKGVEILEPGELLEIAPDRCPTPRIQRFFGGFPGFDPSLRDEDRARREVADAFEAAVSRQLVSDVPVGSYLSGGMDSGSIVSVAGRSIPRIHTFTAGFDLTHVNGIEQGFDERKSAEQLSYLLQSEHYAVVLHAGDMPAAMERLTWHMDDPRAGMCHQVWYVAKLASRFVKVCLSGTGGDELFAGYPWRYRVGLQHDNVRDFDESYFRYWHRLLPPEELPKLIAADLRPHLSVPRASFDAAVRHAPPWEPEASIEENLLQRALAFEFRTFLQGLLLTEDHISMAHSLETRVPFLDNDLADLAWRLPPRFKACPRRLRASGTTGHLDSADGKRVLRRAMESYLPKEFVYQQKQGFSPPDENWYRGPSMDYIKSILFDRRTLERPWFDTGFVEKVLAEHFEGVRNHRLLIWSLLSIEWIQRHYVDATAVPDQGRAITAEVRARQRRERSVAG